MPLRILVVAQALKGTLSVREAAAAVERGVTAAGGVPEVVRGSDGGDGLLEALEGAVVRTSEHQTVDARGRPARVPVGWLDDVTAVVESRLVIGLSLLGPDERDPLTTSTRGLGSLVAQLDAVGVERLVMGLGGSATVDGGVGMLREWGWTPRAADGAVLPEGGGALEGLARLERGRCPRARCVALCDVTNRLTGPEGAAPVFAPQKGARGDDVARLARGLERLADVARGMGRGQHAERAGAGAAGGVGFALAAFWGAELVSGAEWVLERWAFGERLRAVSGVMVCEGRFDRTSLGGKLTGVVVERARGVGLPVVVLAPQAAAVPEGVLVESGGGDWDAAALAARARRGTERLARLLGR